MGNCGKRRGEDTKHTTVNEALALTCPFRTMLCGTNTHMGCRKCAHYYFFVSGEVTSSINASRYTFSQAAAAAAAATMYASAPTNN